MIVLANAHVVLPDRILSPGAVLLEGDRILDVVSEAPAASPGDLRLDLQHQTIVPGFIDVHVHGVEGSDSLDGTGAIARIAAALPRYGVTAFCPTSVACDPGALRDDAERRAFGTPRAAIGVVARAAGASREQLHQSRLSRGAAARSVCACPAVSAADGAFTGEAILDEIAAARPDVGIVTIAPEIDGALALIRSLCGFGHHVSLGHSGATYEQALAGIDAGARHATHLFNRMPPLGHRAPGLAGAVLEHDDVMAEIVCDGVHVHPSMVRVAVAAKSPSRIMAITDATSGAGLAPGARASLGRPGDNDQRCRLPRRWDAGGQRADDEPGICAADESSWD